ncbi:MAG: tetratricopeptide repeat protein [Candidatus Margulisiibacteriota bacterium]
MKKLIILFLLIAYSLSLRPAYAIPFESRLNKGNGLYNRGLFDRAQKVYEGLPKDPLAKYNLGNSLYRQGKFAESEKVFAAVTREASGRDLAQKALYNQGNARFRQENYEGAVNSYEQALRVKPKDRDTLYNLALAKKLLKMPKNQRPRQNKNKKDKQEKQGKNNEKDKSDKKENKPQSGNQQNKQGLSKQDAERILQGLGNNEKHQGKKVKGKGAGNGEDW